MSSNRDNVSLHHIQNSSTDDILPPNSKRRRLNDGQQDENEHSQQYGPIILKGSSCAVVGNVYETHNHFSPPSPQSKQEKLQRVRDSLAFSRMDARLHNVRAALRNTCEWLFRHRIFKEWIDDTKLSEHKGFIWLKGKPGCGKSTLMKGAYNWAKAREDKQWITLSYFFNARAPGLLEKSPLGLYRSLAHEILYAAPHSVAMFDEMFSRKDPSDDAAWTIEELQGFLLKFIGSNDRSPVIVFIDALDEGDERDIRALISFLEDWIAHSSETLSLRICLSSRHYPHITIRTGLSLIVENQTEHGRDIEKYVYEKLFDAANLETSALRATICERSASIFLWVVLVIPILNQIYDQGKSVDDMMAYIENLPEDLEGLFAEILARDAAELRSCVSLLQWVLYSNNPLSSVELYLAIQHSWHRPDEDVITVPTQDILARYLLHHSRGLVEVTKSSPRVVQFIHETVREFLAGDHGLAQIDPVLAGNLPGWSHAKLTQTCLSYFCRNCLRPDFPPYLGSVDDLYGLYDSRREHLSETKIRKLIPFLPYAMKNLLSHADTAQRYGIPQADLLGILQLPDGQVDPNFLFAYNFCQDPVRHFKPDVTTLYVAAEKGFSALISLILASGKTFVNRICGRYGNALQAACYSGDESTVRSLLESGADVNAVCGEYETAFAAAISARHFHLFGLLQMWGLKKQGSIPREALVWMDQPTLRTDVREFLRLGIGKYLPQQALNPGLLAATERLDFEVMELFLQNGADVNHKSGSDISPLMKGVMMRSVKAVSLLISSGVKSNESVMFGDQWTTPLHEALHEASIRGYVSVARVLLEELMELNVDGVTGVLREAIRSGWHQVVQILLERCPDAKARLTNRDWVNALTEACKFDEEKMVRLLLDANAHANDPGAISSGCALLVASERGLTEIVQMLLDDGADVNAEGGSESALAAASLKGHERVVQMLIDRGADTNALRGSYGSALIAASREGHEKIVQILLSQGADVNLKGPVGSALELATNRGHTRVVEMLRAAGARG